MPRSARVERATKETRIRLEFGLDGDGESNVRTGIGFFDHMLTLFCAHGRFHLSLDADGDLEVDAHHTVEDVGLTLGDAIRDALGDRKGIRRYGHAATPMDESLAEVVIDLSNRPFLVWRLPTVARGRIAFDAILAKEFFRAAATRAGMNLHVHVPYGENEHHVLEAIFKSFGRALDQAAGIDPRIPGIPSTKGTL